MIWTQPPGPLCLWQCFKWSGPPNIFPQVDLAVPLRGGVHPGLIIYPDSWAHPLPSPGSHLDCLPPTSENNAMSTSSKTDPNTNLFETFQAQYISECPVAFLHLYLTIAFVMEYWHIRIPHNKGWQLSFTCNDISWGSACKYLGLLVGTWIFKGVWVLVGTWCLSTCGFLSTCGYLSTCDLLVSTPDLSVSICDDCWRNLQRGSTSPDKVVQYSRP